MRKYFKSQKAFTLIELLVVILIIGILIAVAAPSFLGQQDKARDSAAKQDLTVVRKSLKSAWIQTSSGDNGYSASAALLTELENSEPQYTFLSFSHDPLDVTDPDGATVYVDRESDSTVVACQESKSGRVFCLKTFEGTAVDEFASVSSSLFVETAHAAGKTQTLRSNGATMADAVAALSEDSGTPGNAAKGPDGTGTSGWEKTGGEVAAPPEDAGVASHEAYIAAKSYADALVTYVNANGYLPANENEEIDIPAWQALAPSGVVVTTQDDPAYQTAVVGQESAPTIYFGGVEHELDTDTCTYMDELSFVVNGADGKPAYKVLYSNSLDGGEWNLYSITTQATQYNPDALLAADDSSSASWVTEPALPSAGEANTDCQDGPISAGSVDVTGTPAAGETLLIVPSGFNGNNVVFDYRWIRIDENNNQQEVGYSAAYTVTPADMGNTLIGRVTAYNNSHNGTAESSPILPIE